MLNFFKTKSTYTVEEASEVLQLPPEEIKILIADGLLATAERSHSQAPPEILTNSLEEYRKVQKDFVLVPKYEAELQKDLIKSLQSQIGQSSHIQNILENQIQQKDSQIVGLGSALANSQQLTSQAHFIAVTEIGEKKSILAAQKKPKKWFFG